MAYREQALMPVCGECNELATSACVRCNRPSCEQHDSGADTRCIECETEFIRRLSSVNAKTGIAAVIVSAVCGVVLAVAGGAFFRTTNYPAILNLFLALPIGAWSLRAITPARTRTSFLKERGLKALPTRKAPKQLSAPIDPQDRK